VGCLNTNLSLRILLLFDGRDANAEEKPRLPKTLRLKSMADLDNPKFLIETLCVFPDYTITSILSVKGTTLAETTSKAPKSTVTHHLDGSEPKSR
jgi:hypothetical protein